MLQLYLLMRIKFLLHFVSAITRVSTIMEKSRNFWDFEIFWKSHGICLKLGRVIEKSGNFEIGAKSHGSIKGCLH